MNKKSDDRKNPKDLVNNYLPYIRILFLIDKINKPFIHSFIHFCKDNTYFTKIINIKHETIHKYKWTNSLTPYTGVSVFLNLLTQ